MTGTTPKEEFLLSLRRCLVREGFIDLFYQRFLDSSQEVREKFRDTNMEKQGRILIKSLRLCAGATCGDPVSLCELTERALSHSRENLNIAPKLYQNWLTAILSAAQEYDDLWSEEIEEAWRTVLGHVIRHMIKHY